MILGEYQSPGGKFFGKQNSEKNVFLGKKRVFLTFFQHQIISAALKILMNTENVRQ